MQIERISTMKGGTIITDPQKMQAVFGTNADLFNQPNVVHLVCGLAGEYCVLDTAVNLSLHCQDAQVIYLDNYTEYASYGLPKGIALNNFKHCNTFFNHKTTYQNLKRQKYTQLSDMVTSLKKASRVYLWVIDMQNDFCEGGSFGVAGSKGLYNTPYLFLKDMLKL